MADTLLLILAVSAVTYGTRIAGLALGAGTAIRPVRGLLHYIPIAVFAALAAPDIGGWDRELPARLTGAALAAMAILVFKRLWAAVGLGMAGFWLVRLVAG